MGKQFWEIKNAAAPDTTEVWIYQQIGADWWSEGVEAKQFCQELATIKTANIDLHINSPGGSVFDGLAIYNALQRHPANVTSYVDGLAASIASVIALAGSKVVMAENALFMIHNPWGFAQGSAEDMRKCADVLDKCKDSIMVAYRNKTGLDDAALSAAMDAETWYSAEEAQSAGFVDEVAAELKLAASATTFDFQALGFKKAPQAATVTVEVEVDTADNVSLEPDAEEMACYCTGATPEMTCTDCQCETTCINPTKSTAASAASTQAPAANIEEVVIMSHQTTAPANGAQEAAEIVMMCVQHGKAEAAAQFIKDGLSADQVGRKLLEMGASAHVQTPAAEASNAIDLGKDANKYSYKNAIAIACALREGKAVAGFELDVHQQLLKSMPQNYAAKGGLIVPMQILNTTLTTGGAGTGAELVQTEYGQLIEYLYNKSVINRMGANVLTGLVGPLSFPKQTGSATLSWTGEAPGSDTSASNPTTAFVTLSPKTAMSTVALSRNLLVQSTPNAEALVRNDLGMVAALGIDRAAIHGLGSSNEPDGLYHLTGVNAKAMGGVPTFGKLQDMITECALDNALFANAGFVTTPGMAGKLAQTLVASAAGSDMIWKGAYDNGTMNGYKALASNQISAIMSSSTPTGGSEHGIVFGDFSQLIVGQWGGIELIVDPFTSAKKGLVEITLFMMADIIARHPGAFCKSTGATIA